MPAISNLSNTFSGRRGRLPTCAIRTLRQLLDERKRLNLDESLPILAQLADALDYLGGQGLVHRDVKPANVMIENEERDLCVTLTDFGLVRSPTRCWLGVNRLWVS